MGAELDSMKVLAVSRTPDGARPKQSLDCRRIGELHHGLHGILGCYPDRQRWLIGPRHAERSA